MDKQIVYRVEDGMDRSKVLCTTYQMRNFYSQFRDGFFTNLDVMNYIQHFAAAQMAKKGMNIVDVCCGRSLMLPLLRYYAKGIASYTGVDISRANIKEAMRGATEKKLKPEDLGAYYPFKVRWKLGNVANMSDIIPEGFADFVIYTSALEHMHKDDGRKSVPFPVSWTVKMKKKQKETQDILSYHSQAAGCSDKARAKASGGRQPIEECGRTGL